MRHDHFLACGSARQFMTYMFWRSRSATKRRRSSVVLALVYSARIWLLRVVSDVSPIIDRIGQRSTYLQHKQSRFCLGNISRGGRVDQPGWLLWRRGMDVRKECTL